MALNPIAYTENVLKSFLRYQFTAYAFTDQRLREQMRNLLSLDETRSSPLLKGPYISLSRPFRQGASVESLQACCTLTCVNASRPKSRICTAIRKKPFGPSLRAAPRWSPQALAPAKRSASFIPSSAIA